MKNGLGSKRGKGQTWPYEKMNLKAKRGQKGAHLEQSRFLEKVRELGVLNGEICELLHENQRLK